MAQTIREIVFLIQLIFYYTIKSSSVVESLSVDPEVDRIVDSGNGFRDLNAPVMVPAKRQAS